MKKIIALMLLLAILVSCCACNADPSDTPETTEPASGQVVQSEKEMNAQLYGHIDQTKPDKTGVYRLWNAEGVKTMAENPGRSYRLLCNIDMEGAELKPIGSASQPFTGILDGNGKTISNFTIRSSAEGELGFVAVNDGDMRSLTLTGMTVIADSGAKHIGALAGTNNSTIFMCNATGTLTVDAAAADAACGAALGINNGEISSSIITVDLAYNASGSAKIGGLTGICQGTLDASETHGKLDITNGSGKIYGLLVGEGKDSKIDSCSFIGPSSTVDGESFSAFVGKSENVTTSSLLWRDNSAPELPENVRKLREQVVAKMYEMGTIEWKVREPLPHSCWCSLTSCYGDYSPVYTYYGMPYTHNEGTLTRFQYVLDEEGYIKDFVYDFTTHDGDLYYGNDCAGAVMQSWWTVSNTVNYMRTIGMYPQRGFGTIPVGDYRCDFDLDGDLSLQFTKLNDEQTMYESYAQIRAGDAMVMNPSSGHARMAAADAVVVRNEKGEIDGHASYVITHEQGSSTDTETTRSRWKLYGQYSFAGMYANGSIPITCEELLTGEMEPVECELLDGVEGKLGMTTGLVQANYYLDCVTLEIKNSKDEVVFDQVMFATVGRMEDTGHNDSKTRAYNDKFDLATFATPLQKIQFERGESYSYSITVHLATGDDIVVKTDSFTNGQA